MSGCLDRPDRRSCDRPTGRESDCSIISVLNTQPIRLIQTADHLEVWEVLTAAKGKEQAGCMVVVVKKPNTSGTCRLVLSHAQACVVMGNAEGAALCRSTDIETQTLSELSV